ncbi:antibiotic biosynthesis monooxygenase [Parvibaculum sp.]|uniref:antibiotic biosynthesis monooxygenase n=1 Tax=Parvibaculum sp. TaxID=2024848 RepID=UPI0039194336
MKAAIYRWRVKPEDEEYFARRWHEITEDIMARHGGGGSRLHRAENGDFVAYARWPSRAARDKAFADYSKDPDRAIPQREGKAELIEEIWLDVLDDLLIPEAELPERFRAR